MIKGDEFKDLIDALLDDSDTFYWEIVEGGTHYFNHEWTPGLDE